MKKGHMAKLEAKSCDNKGIGIFASVFMGDFENGIFNIAP